MSHPDKNEPGRFLGEGVSFRAKLIGVLEVPEARGDRMCQEALADLKMAIRAAGEHKQRIQVHVAIDGLRLRDDKTGDSLYHHPVHKISFIAQDMTDSRAFGYIFGSPDTGHRFFGIKTDKAASQVVIAMRDLFQVVFELKKKEIELAKQQLEGKSAPSITFRHTGSIVSEKSKLSSSTEPTTSKPVEAGAEGGVAELVDLEQELSSLRRGLTQVEGLTPSIDPFGDSFIAPPSTNSAKSLLPPPPSGSSTRGRNTPSSKVFSPNKNQTSLSFDLATVAADFEPVVPTTVPENIEPSTADTSSIRQRPQPSTKLSESASPPPPLPPKKCGDAPPPRPPHDSEVAPPIPPPARRHEQPERGPKPRLSSAATNSSEDEYLSPVPPPLPGARRFDITLSQLLTCSMEELSIKLRVPEATLSSMTLPQLTTYLRSYLAADVDRAHIYVDPSINPVTAPVEHKKESLLKTTLRKQKEPPRKDQFEDNFSPTPESGSTFVANFDDFETKAYPSYDRYAAFREIQEEELKTKSIIDLGSTKNLNGDTEQKNDSEKEETSLTELVGSNQDLEIEQVTEKSKSPLKTLDELTLDSFNMFRNSVSPKPSQIDSKIEDIKNVMKNLQIEQKRRSVSPRDNGNADHKDESDRYAALREITITEPQDEFESLPPEHPKERKKSDEKSDGFDNSDFFDCIDNSSLSFSHVEDAFRKSPIVKEKVEKEKVEEKSPKKEVVRNTVPPPRLSTESLSDVVSASSPDIKDAGGRAGRWSVLAARASPWSSDEDSGVYRRRKDRQTSSSSRDVSPWDEDPPVTRHHRPPSHHRESRHNSSQGSRECLDSGSIREKIKIRDKRDRSDISRDGRDSESTRERDRRDSGSGRDRRSSKDTDRREKRSRDKDWDRERNYSRERDYRDPRRGKDYREKDRDRSRKHHSWDDEEDYSEGCGSGRSSPRERWPDHRYRRDERKYGSLGWRETRRRAELRQAEEPERRYGSSLSRAPPRREPERRRRREERVREERARDQRFCNDLSSRDHDLFDHDHDRDRDYGDGVKKRAPYSTLEGTRFAFEPDDTASPISVSSSRAHDSQTTRFRFDSDSVSPRSMFEDDFTLPTTRARAASIAEEDEGDLPPLRQKTQTTKDIKKSESVNIFVRETDPFEGDDFFACTGSDRAARRENWPGDFQAFDT